MEDLYLKFVDLKDLTHFSEPVLHTIIRTSPKKLCNDYNHFISNSMGSIKIDGFLNILKIKIKDLKDENYFSNETYCVGDATPVGIISVRNNNLYLRSSNLKELEILDLFIIKEFYYDKRYQYNVGILMLDDPNNIYIKILESSVKFDQTIFKKCFEYHKVYRELV